MATYVVSDLHGYNDIFEEGLELIGFSDEDQLYVIGDAIDRGPDGIRILSTVMQRENMELLLGNHEFMMLNAVNPGGGDFCDGKDTNVWLYANGGDRTFEKYCRLSPQERAELLAWLNGRGLIKTLAVNGRTICLTHSYYDEKCIDKRYEELRYQEVFHVVWTSIFRDDIYTHGEDIYGEYDCLFITGHVPVQKVMRWYGGDPNYNGLDVYIRENLIDIDGGLAMGFHPGMKNGAIFLRLEDMQPFVVPL